MPANPSTLSLIIQGLLALAAGGTGTAIVNALLSRRKTSAEAAKTQAETGRTQAEVTGLGTKNSAEQVDISLDMVREMRATQERLETKVDRLEAWKLRHETRMDAHVRWDEKVWAVLQDAGIQIDAPPQLRDSPH